MTQTIDQAGETADRQLERQIWSFLESHHVPSLRHVCIEAQRGTVTLRGRVSSFYAKQLLQHSARRLAGEGQVIDEVEVATPSNFRGTSPLGALAAGAAMLLVALVTGCSKSEPRVPVQPVSGQITFDGKPAKGARVVFHPKSASEPFPSPSAYADAQGNFAISTYSTGDGAPQGEYTVTVQWQPPVIKDGDYQAGPDLVPAKFRSAKTSTLTARVAEGANSVPLKITR
jgi:hypothetical protein